ncbi:MAG TPA: hypothetical protein VLT33_42930 [Labilithrix sp.]|nr:hypothetical protein [Labilithrix sp.]
MLPRGYRRLFVAAVAVLVPIAASCDSSVRVGELREEPAEPAEGGPLLPPPDAATLPASWRLHAPRVPCSIYAMAEARSDDVWLGCNGGRIYRYDGVQARLAFSGDERSIVSLLWLAGDGQLWAGAQVGFGDTATTTLHRFDGAVWHDVPGPKERVTSISGDPSSVWITTGQKILRVAGGSLETSFTSTAGTFRACAFADAKRGYCVGTEGLALAWDGLAWSPVAAPPWSPKAEVFGVELDPLYKSAAFFYGEPITSTSGDHQCTVARLTGTFVPLQASTPCFTDFSVARKRTGRVWVGAREYLLIAPEAQYGGALVFDPGGDAVRPLCGPVLSFATGLANTRVAGFYGLLATIVGSGGNQIALTSARGSNTTFEDLSVAPDGTAWARVQDATACGSVSDALVRFEADATWGAVAGPQGAQSGRGLTATAIDRAYTIDIGRDVLLQHTAGAWSDGATIASPWSLFASRTDDVWIGGVEESFGHFDGRAYREIQPPGRRRQIEQILPAGSDVWMVAQGVTAGDTDVHVVRYANGKTTEWNQGLSRVWLAALDATHVWMSGEPAQVWDGATWTPLAFDASNVWARSKDEVYFTDGGDISRWDGKHLERMFHGFIPIRAIAGSRDRAFAVGPGGLTLELGHWPDATR